MSTNPTEGDPTAADPQEGEQISEQEGESSQLEEGQEAESKESKEGEKLTDEQKTIRKLQRRIERLSGKVGATSRERDLLRDQLSQQPTQAEEEPDGPQAIERQATERAREIVRGEALNTKAQSLLEAGRKIDGFDAALSTLREEVAFVDANGRVSPFLEALLDSDPATSAALAKHLGDNPDEAAEFNGLSPAQLGRRLAKLEAQLAQDGKKQVSNAPPPLKPVSGSGHAGTHDLSKLSAEDYMKARAKQGARWAR